MRNGNGINGMNLGAIKQIQQNLMKVRKELEQITVDGIAGPVVIGVRVSDSALQTIKIDHTLLQNIAESHNEDGISLEESKYRLLEDFIVAAYNNAKRESENKSEHEMKKIGISPEMLKMME